MCDGYSWVYALIAAAGAYAQNEAANDAADRQQKALNDALDVQDQYSKKAEQTALQNADEYKQDTRSERLEEAKTAAGDTLAQSLIKSREDSGTVDQAQGRLSSTFDTDRSSKMADQFQKSVDMARLMGRMRGVQDMIGNESITNADYASRLGTIGRNAKGAYDAAQPGIISAGKVNSGQVALGALAQSVGTSGLMSGLGSAFGGDITSSQAAANYGTTAGSQQSSMLAAQEAGMGTGGAQNYFKMFGR